MKRDLAGVAARVDAFAEGAANPNQDWGITLLSDAAGALMRAGVGITLNERQEVIPNLSNHIAVLRDHPRFAGKFWFDSFRQDIFTTWDGPEARAWVDSDRLRLTAVLQGEHGLAKFNDDAIEKAVIAIAQGTVRDELADWLRSLRWDGAKRLDTWLTVAAGTPADEYHQAVARCFLISMVARGMQPGCKVDTMPIFEGPQGAMKSTLLSVLGGRHYLELNTGMEGKDFFLSLRGKWLVEVAELDAFRRSDVKQIKRVLTTRTDSVRPPYMRRDVDMPRRAVFAGTTNESDYLSDPSGARRFWPVRVQSIDLAWLRVNRDQLFAEAMERLNTGAQWWDVPTEAAKAQTELRRDVDVWERRISDYCVGHSMVDVSAVLEALGVEVARQGKAEQMRAANALRSLGYHRAKRRFGLKTQWVWVRPEADDDSAPF